MTGPSAGPNRMATESEENGRPPVLLSCAASIAAASGTAPPDASRSTCASADSDSERPGRRMDFSVTLRLPGSAIVGERRRTSIIRATWSLGSSWGIVAVGFVGELLWRGECGFDDEGARDARDGSATRTIHQHLLAGGSLFAMDLSVMWGTMPPISSPLRFCRRA